MHARVHAYLGLALLIPLFVWAVTGVVFIIKPGYEAAYAQLRVKTLPIHQDIHIPTSPKWREVRYIRTILGWHLLVVDEHGRNLHLHPKTRQPWALPYPELAETLMQDSVAFDAERYGKLLAVERQDNYYIATTSTSVRLELNWENLELRQEGRDTRFISRLYRMHYLQWTPNPIFNVILACGALCSLLALGFFGLKLFIYER